MDLTPYRVDMLVSLLESYLVDLNLVAVAGSDLDNVALLVVCRVHRCEVTGSSGSVDQPDTL